MTVQILQGDCREVLAKLDASSVDACVTDPPYGLSFMGKAWDYDVPGVDVWQEVYRVLKPGAHLLAFFGSRTFHRGVVKIEDAGFEIRDQIMWIYGSGFPKSHNLKGEWEGWGTALKPAHEPIVVARKPLAGTVAENMAEHGVGAINIDESRVHADDAQGGEYKIKRFAPGASINKDGNWKQETEFTGEMKPGRWPANVIHDGSEEVLSAFPEAQGQQGPSSDNQRTRANVYGALSHGGKQYTPRGDSGSAARFFYCAKADKKDRDEYLNSVPEKPIVTFQTANGTSGKASSISEGRKTSYKNTHPTVKPTALMRYLCKLVTPRGGIILDPFMGSGSTGKAAVLEQFSFIGIEIDPDFAALAQNRINGAAGLFAEVGT